MKQLKIRVFLLPDEEEFKMGESLILEISKNLYIKVRTLSIMPCDENDKKFRQFKILND